MSQETDHDLMLAVARGSADAFAQLYRRHQVALFGFFRRQGQGRAGSEDLMQDTWLRVLRYAASYRDEGRFAPWLYRIARNVLADAITRQGADHTGDDAALELAPAAPGDTPEVRLSAAELDQRLARALARLAPDRRELVLLSRVRQLDMNDLARLFDCSVPTVKVRLHRSLKQLRAYFDETGHQAPARGHDEDDGV